MEMERSFLLTFKLDSWIISSEAEAEEFASEMLEEINKKILEEMSDHIDMEKERITLHAVTTIPPLHAA